jgi:hypothetical protein
VDLSRLSREDWTVAGGGLLLAFGLIAFPWSTVTIGGYSLPLVATAGAGGLWADLALIVLVAVIVDVALARFSPQTRVPTTQLGRETTRAAALGVMGLLMFTRLLAHTGSYSWGFYADVILLVAVASAGWLNAQGHATPPLTRSRSWHGPRRASRAGH